MRRIFRKYLLCLLALLLLVWGGAALADGLEVHFLDIGRNDGILIRCDGEDVFIDAGGYYRGEVATAYMKQVGVTHLKYYIGTHAHEDHVGGAPVIIEAFRPDAILQPHKRVKEVIIENIRSTKQKDVVRNANYVDLTVGQSVQVGGAELRCLGPVRVRSYDPEWGEENENSLVLMLTYGETDILLTADATADSLLAVEAAYPGSLRADVLKSPHHNQYLKKEVYSLIDPQYTVFSTSKDRLPEAKYIKLLNEFGTPSFSTTENHSGNLILRTDGQNIEFVPQYRTESLTLDKSELVLYKGKSDKIKVTTVPARRAKLLLYESLNPDVATVDHEGRITAVNVGTAVIRVSDAAGAYADCTVTVSPPRLKLKKSEVSVKDGARVSLGWSVEPSGSKDVPVWASLDESIAVVDQKGRVTGIYPGQTVITATMPSGVVSQVSVTVTPIAVSKVSVKYSSMSVTIGESRTVTASVSPSNATWKDIVWTSADESIVSVTPDGVLYAAGVGKTKLTAAAVGGKTKTVSVTVKPVYVKKILFTQDKAELIVGVEGHESAQLHHVIEPANATIQGVTWTSSNKKIVSVDENGVITAHKQGNATITCKATDGSGKYAKIKVYVELPTEQIVLNKTAVEVYEGTTYTLKATIKPASKTKRLFWESSDVSVAVVNDSGKVTGVRSGTAIIRVRDAMGIYAECSVTVKTTEMELKKTALTVKDGSRVSAGWKMLPSSAKPVIVWTSADEQIASVDQNGRITGVYPGETVITATMPSGQTHEIALTVTPIYVTYVGIKPSSLSMSIGDSRSVKASVSPSNATWKDVEWSSEDESIVTVTPDGLVRAVGVGKTKIRAAAAGGKSRTASVTVKPIYVKSIALSKPNVELIGGVVGRNQVQISHIVEPANATIQAVTWSSSNKKIATVDENGLVTGLKEGTVTITCKATDGSGRYKQMKVTFKPNELKRSVTRVEGEMVVQATRLRYRDNGATLEVTMTYDNRSGKSQKVPYRGTLVLIAPDGTEIVLTQINASQSTLKNKYKNEFTYKIPVSVNPRLRELDLTRCDAVIKNIIP